MADTPRMSQKVIGAMWNELFRRSRRDGLSLQGQIRAMMVDAIHAGVLPPGEPIPSSRELAEQLEVGRITVVLAYQQLSEEEFLISRQRKGHFVNPDVHRGQVTQTPPRPQPEVRRKTDWSRRLCLQALGLAVVPLSLPVRPVRQGPVPHRRLARVLHEGTQRAGHPRVGA